MGVVFCGVPIQYNQKQDGQKENAHGMGCGKWLTDDLRYGTLLSVMIGYALILQHGEGSEESVDSCARAIRTVRDVDIKVQL